MNTGDMDVRNHRARPDRRVVRTRRALGQALMRLLEERELESVTVQQVLDAAGVARATFYGHFRGKHDLLLSHFETVMEWLDALLALEPPESRRVAPVAEICSHLADARGQIGAIAASGQLDALWDLGQSHLNGMIARRLALLSPGTDHTLASRFCGGALSALLRWWLWRTDRPTPREMDALYHEMVWKGSHRGTESW
ncbi:MAG TPA: helix-turn-helix domain-containing protein [Longimicrobium sp.]|jgi:AcrR family transcriptional regulator